MRYSYDIHSGAGSKTYDVVNDVVYDILRYDVVYDIVYDISRYDVVYDIVYDISRYDVVYDVVCDVIYEIVYFSVPWFGGVALPDPGLGV